MPMPPGPDPIDDIVTDKVLNLHDLGMSRVIWFKQMGMYGPQHLASQVAIRVTIGKRLCVIVPDPVIPDQFRRFCKFL